MDAGPVCPKTQAHGRSGAPEERRLRCAESHRLCTVRAACTPTIGEASSGSGSIWRLGRTGGGMRTAYRRGHRPRLRFDSQGARPGGVEVVGTS